LAGEQLGQRSFDLPRDGLGLAQFGSDTGGMRFSILEPLLDRSAFLFKLRDRLRGIALERFLASDVSRQRRIEQLQLCQTPGDRVAPRTRGGELMGERMALLTQLGKRGAAPTKCLVCAFVCRLRFGDGR